MHIRLSLISKIRYRKKVVYNVNPSAGLANTLRGMASTIFLSYLYSNSFFLKGWKSITHYFNFPKVLIICKDLNYTHKFKKFNKSLLNILKNKSAVMELTDIHGFIDSILYSSYTIKILYYFKKRYKIKKINKKIINSIIYNEFFIPSCLIKFYIHKFKLKKKFKKVLGIHIRSGIFYNNFTEDYFSKEIKLNTYIIKASQLIKQFNISYIYIIADNEKYINELKLHFKNQFIEIYFVGKIIHSRFSLYKAELNSNAIRIISEFMILSNCDAIIGTKRSSFSSESCNVKMKYCVFV